MSRPRTSCGCSSTTSTRPSATTGMNVAKARGLTFYQVLTLASIVEQEAVVDDERPLIAGVYQNRLNQEDAARARTPPSSTPTTRSAAPSSPSTKWVKLLLLERSQAPAMARRAACPTTSQGFQTYNNGGLIPGPICTPTAASIDAALDPNTKTGYLYFVAIRDATARPPEARVREDRSRAHRQPQEVRLHQVSRGPLARPARVAAARRLRRRRRRAGRSRAGPRRTGRPDRCAWRGFGRGWRRRGSTPTSGSGPSTCAT